MERPSVHPLLAIPEELCLRIFSFLNATDLVSIAALSRDLYRLASDNTLWHALCTCNYLPTPPPEERQNYKSWFGRIARSCLIVDRKKSDGDMYGPPTRLYDCSWLPNSAFLNRYVARERERHYVPVRVFASIERCFTTSF